MATRTGSAIWDGTLKQGKGTMKLGSGAFEGPYSFSSRFEEGKGTNPEELIGAAEAGCYSMALSANLESKRSRPRKPVRFRSRWPVPKSTSTPDWFKASESLARALELDHQTFSPAHRAWRC